MLVLAAPCAAGVIDRPLVAAQVAGAFVVLCLVSSATYLVNDVRDVEQDRLHPRKRMRPIAAGELSPRFAMWSGGGAGSLPGQRSAPRSRRASACSRAAISR